MTIERKILGLFSPKYIAECCDFTGFVEKLPKENRILN